MLKKRNFKVYLKPHPRLGYSDFLKEKIYYIANSNIPAELIDDSSFNMIIGIISSALAYFAEKDNSKVISLINIYDFQKSDVKKRFYEYLNDLSDNINYVNTIEGVLK